jgi:hypothetical protein
MRARGAWSRVVRRRWTWTGFAGVLLLMVAGSSGESIAQPTRAGHAAAAGPLAFSHAVVVDQQRPGFEPDVKVDGNGVVYSSVPFGFSTTQSFVWSSRDRANSYQLVPGNIGPGKPSTCVGGGDTDLFVDPGNALYFSDLQGLTNISNSVSTDGGAHWTTNCAGAPVNSPDDRMWFAGTGSTAAGNLTLYQDFDQVGTSPSGGNQLVEEVTHDGTDFQPVVNPNPTTTNCLGTAVNCVTDNEGISGNQVVDPSTGIVYIVHTSTEGSSGSPGVRVSAGQITAGSPTTAVWTDSPNLDASLCPNPTCTDSSGNPEELAGENFATIARDSGGYLYVTFTAGPLDHANSSDPNFGALTAPEQIYVVHSLEPAGSNPAALTWSAPQKITGSGASAGTNTFPWIVAGSAGRVDVAWYHTNELSEQGTCASGSGTCTVYGAGSFKNAEWSVQMAQSLNASAASPAYTTANVSETYVKHGQICTNGIGCATGGDRSLGDFLQVTIDNQGAALVSYVFDTSADTSAGEDAGPEVISRQIGGPSLLASVGAVDQNGGPGVPMGSITDPTGDADYSANGTRVAAPDNLDLTGASLANGSANDLIATIHVKSLSSLTAPSSVGGPDASWMLRWTDVQPGTTGNGHIFYAGMDNNQGTGGSGQPTFFDGDTAGIPPANAAEHTKYLSYPQTHQISGSYDAPTGTITLHIPRSDVGSPVDGTPLYSITAFTATSTSPQSSTTLFNLIDAASPFELVVGPPGFEGPVPKLTGSGAGVSNLLACPAASGRLTSRAIGPVRLGMPRSSAHRMFRWSTGGRRYWDYFCFSPVGTRAGYPSPALLRLLPRKQRKGAAGRIIFILSDNHRYVLRGVHPGMRFTKRLARRLHLGRGFRLGPSSPGTWYVLAGKPSAGLIEVHAGKIQGVGLADPRFIKSRSAELRFLNFFR